MSRRAARILGGCVAGVALGWFALPFAFPIPVGLAEEVAESPVMLDRHGTPIRHLALADARRARPVSRAELPPDLVAATLAAEDKRFYEHGGLDFLAVARSARDCVVKRRVVSGASTITQQMVKISSPRAERNLWTKARETLVARRLEMTWTKDEILTAYLNRLDYGNFRTGSAEAARFYFQKPLGDLSLGECALLAGLPQAPSRLNPLRHPARALKRRDTVLRRLEANGNYDVRRVEVALAEPLVLRPLEESRAAPWLAGDGRLRTTLDLPLQRDLEAVVREEVARLRQTNLRHAAVVAVENATGEILALVSSADWEDGRGGQLNGALVPRSPGSTLKPFTYLLAMERNGRTPVSILADIPTPFRTPQGLDLPENYDRAYRGPVTLRSALACSLNVPALRELNALPGGPRALHDFLNELGITTLGEDPTAYGLGLTLGNAPVKLLELTGAYSTLARLGRHREPVLFAGAAAKERRIFEERTGYLIADILSDGGARAPSFPPGGPLDLPFRCAVKTGTSSDFHDNWCLGYTPEYTVGVWAGNFEHQPMSGISGVAGAGPIFHRAMARLHLNRPATWYDRPPGLVDVMIDARNGKSPAESNRHARRDICQAERMPEAAVAEDFDESGKALLDGSYAAWFASGHNQRRGELALDAAAVGREPFKIISPADDATFLLDPEIPSGSDRLRPVTNLPGTARWESDTLRIEPGSPEPVIHLSPGTHVITVTDPRTGETRHLRVHVKKL